MGRPITARAQRHLDEFYRWWWKNRRREFIAWLRSRHHLVPKPTRRAYRQSGQHLSNWMV